MEKKPSDEFVEFDIIIHIFSVSATLVGVCLTVIGIFIMSRRLSHVESYGEELLAIRCPSVPGNMHSIVCRTAQPPAGEKHRLECITEEMFFVALILIAFICVFIVFELI